MAKYDIVEQELRRVRRQFLIGELIKGAVVFFFIGSMFWFVSEMYL